MSKEIIIDGVNVAGCVQLVEEPFYPCGLGGECKGWENCYYKQLKRLEQENAKLKQDIEAYKQSEQEATEIITELKTELQKFKDMAKKGLDEFKDVGGCWGCGLQLQLNQDLEDIKQLKTENERLKARKDKYYQQTLDDEIQINELYQVL